MEIDVLLATKNACLEKGKETFIKCLDRIFNEIRVHNLIVVDAESIDETLSIVEAFRQEYDNVLILRQSNLDGGIGKAWEQGFSQMNTDWFAIISSDCILLHNWQQTMEKYLGDSVGIVDGYEQDPTSTDIQYSEAMSLLRKRIAKKDRTRSPGFSGSVLIRTSCVKDIRIPKIFRKGCDVFLKRKVLDKGYKCVLTEELVAEHRGAYLYSPSARAQNAGALVRVLNLKSFSTIILNLVKAFPKALFTSLRYRTPIFLYVIVREWQTLVGWLHWTEHYF
ncbi:MAG: glycosyltransferase [Candidatus Bathyarchaeota archaeon]|nr:glycosyltransferase [Candidatus Bathyarchaeota archaeon]